MALWQGRSRRKPTGGRYRPFRKKRRREIGREQQWAFIGPQRLKLYRTKGANRKVRVLSAEFANVLDRKTSVTKKVKIVTVKANPSNPNFVTRNIITRGATIQTDLGLARVTSRPGQDGVVNAVLVEAPALYVRLLVRRRNPDVFDQRVRNEIRHGDLAPPHHLLRLVAQGDDVLHQMKQIVRYADVLPGFDDVPVSDVEDPVSRDRGQVAGHIGLVSSVPGVREP